VRAMRLLCVYGRINGARSSDTYLTICCSANGLAQAAQYGQGEYNLTGATEEADLRWL